MDHDSVQFSHTVVSLWDPTDCSTPGFPVHHKFPVCSDSYPSSRWCHSTISFSVIPFSCLQSCPPSGSFPMSQFFASGGQSIGVNSFCVSSSNEYWGLISFRMDWLDLLAVQGTLKSLLNTIVQKHQFVGAQLSLQSSSHINTWLLEKTELGLDRPLSVISLLFNILSMLGIAFHAKSKHLLISWLQSPSAVILEPKKIKSVTISIVSPSICHEVMGSDAMIFVFECWILSHIFHTPLSSRLFSSSLLSLVSSVYLKLLIFLPESWFQFLLHPGQHFAWCTWHRS